MNYLYVNPKSPTGVPELGTMAAPFRTMSALIAGGITHPCTIFLKRNTTLVDDANFGTTMVNPTSTESVIMLYGSGRRPRWFKKSTSGTHIRMADARNCRIKGYDLRERNDRTTVNNGGSYIDITLVNNTAQAIDSNVWIDDVNLTGPSHNRSGLVGGNKSIYIHAADANTNRVNKFGLLNSKLRNLSRGVQLQGVDLADDKTDNSKGTYYSRGVVVRKTAFVGMSNGAVCFVGIESPVSAYTTDADQSGAFRCTYSSYRWDRYDGTTIRPDAAFWTYHCNNVMFERLTGGGMQPTEADSEFIDFDGLSWGCVARFIVSYNNGAGSLWISTDKQPRAAYSDYSTVYTEFEWYYTRRNGSGNNVIEYSIFYNDGNQKAYVNPSTSCAYHRYTGYQYGNIVRNVVHINTTAENYQYILHDSFAAVTSQVPSITFDSCMFYWLYSVNTAMVSDTGRLNSTTLKFVNCLINSKVWATADITAMLANLGAVASLTGTLTGDPLFEFVPTQPLVSLDAAKLMNLLSTSPCWGAGSQSTSMDINGKQPKDIFWRAPS